MIGRAFMLVSLGWVGFCLWGFNDSGELRHMTLENYAMMFAPFMIRLAVLFVLYGLPRGPRQVSRPLPVTPYPGARRGKGDV